MRINAAGLKPALPPPVIKELPEQAEQPPQSIDNSSPQMHDESIEEQLIREDISDFPEPKPVDVCMLTRAQAVNQQKQIEHLETLDANSEAQPSPLGTYPVEDAQVQDQSTPVADARTTEHQQSDKPDPALAELPGPSEDPLPILCPRVELIRQQKADKSLDTLRQMAAQPQQDVPYFLE